VISRILSIPGGGIRGVLPACHLVELERQTGKLTRDIFTAGLAGTSTGGLLCASCAAGIPAKKSLDVYLTQGRRIFSPTNRVLRTANMFSKGRQFDVKVLSQVVADTLGPAASWKIDDSPVPLLLTATDQNGDVIYFSKSAPTNSGKFGKYSMLQAAVASGAATTYHDPPMVNGLGYCADGGVGGVADPCYAAAVEFFTGHKCYGSINPNDALMFSIGTGFYRADRMADPPGFILDRIKFAIGSLVGNSRTIAEQSVERHWPGVLRILNSQLNRDIDEADVDAIPYLYELGQKAASQIDWSAILS
jgi:patatin-like phospholipase/acyl hydrolase